MCCDVCGEVVRRALLTHHTRQRTSNFRRPFIYHWGTTGTDVSHMLLRQARTRMLAAGGLAWVATKATVAEPLQSKSTTALFRLDGRVALVTGSTRGIGHAMAVGLADQGATVVLHGSSPTNLEAARTALLQANPAARCSIIAFDVGDEVACRAAVATVVQQHGRLDVLVNNAGVNKRQPLDALSTDAYQRVLDCNLLGPAVLAQEAAAVMRKQGWGRIINVGSIMSHVGRTGLLPYCSSKHALLGLTRALAAELGADGITVNCVCPGYIETEFTAPIKRDSGFDAVVCDRNPQGRWGQASQAKPSHVSGDTQRRATRTPTPPWLGQAHEFRGVVAFLASDAASYVNGASLVVDGGFTESFHVGGVGWRGQGGVTNS